FVTFVVASLCLYDTATTQIYTLSLHDALPIFYLIALAAVARVSVARRQRVLATAPVTCAAIATIGLQAGTAAALARDWLPLLYLDRKSTRLNSSHQIISYAVFCLKKKIQTS